MRSIVSLRQLQHTFFIALPLSITLLFLFPAHSHAQAVLLRSDPIQNAALNSTPTRVRIWFSDNLNPSNSTASVVNSANQRIDLNNAHISATDSHEIDVALQPLLVPGTYSVLWTTQSADDGSVLRGSFLFSITEPNGTVPKANGSLPGLSNPGLFDGPTFFNFMMVTLIDLGTIFWVGAQLWRIFVLHLTEQQSDAQETIEKQAEIRFDRQFSFPLLALLLLANIGLIIGQAFTLTDGNSAQSFAPTMLVSLVTNGSFGTYWTMREVVILLALLLGIITDTLKKMPHPVTKMLSWLNLILSMALLLALTLSGHEAAGDIPGYTVIIDWLHLLAASLWIGGLLYISIIYLPVLKQRAFLEGARSLITTLPHYSALAITGILILLVTGPFDAATRMNTFDQLITTEYGHTLIVKSLLVAALIITSAIHIGRLRPQLAKEYKNLVSLEQRPTITVPTSDEAFIQPVLQASTSHLEASIKRRASRLTGILQWGSVSGIAILICTGLLSVFGGSLQQIEANQATQSSQSKGFTTTIKTNDKQFIVTLTISPDRSGPNTFTATVFDNHGVKAVNVSVSIDATMLEMDMGTTPIKLQPDGKGHFSATGNLDMGGKWGLRVEIRGPDLKLHEANAKIVAAN
ncbi:MAG: copper resistance protein CopC [Ktedonobacteraceae bacterium]|nr:copper resistance protein CopC [Ktedonobacteraceae bacterium]